MANNTVTVKIVGDATSLKQATSTASAEVEGLGDKANKASNNGNDPLGTIGKKIDIGNLMNASETIAGVGSKVLEIGKKSIESSANLQAMNSTFKQTFGDTLPFAEQQVDKLSKAYDILPNRIKPSYQQFTAMFKGLGLDTQQAAEKATQAMRISANAAAFYDKSLEDSNSSLQSFVKGNYEGGESIGLFANETQIQAYAIKNNLIPATEGQREASEKALIAYEKASNKVQEMTAKYGEGSLEARDATVKLQEAQEEIDKQIGPQTQKWADLDEATKQAVRLDYAENMMVQAGALDEVGKMTGQASRESGEYENQMGNAQQALEDFYAVLGEDILPVFLEALQLATKGLSTLAEWFSNLPQPVKTFIFVLGGLLAVFSQLAPIITAVVAIIGAFAGVALGPLIAVVAGVVVAITAAIEIFRNWGAITDWLSEKWTAFREFAGQLWEGIKTMLSGVWTSVVETTQTIWNGLVGWLSALWEALKQTMSTVWEGLKVIVSGAWTAIRDITSTIWNGIQQVLSSIWNSIKQLVSSAIEAVKNVVSSGWNGVKSVTSSVLNGVSSVVSSIWNGIKSTVGNLVNGISSAVSSAWNNIKSTTSSIFNGIKSVASSAWEGIKSAITRPIEQARDTVKRIVESIKGFFSNMRLSIPSIKLPPMPHFRVNGSFSLNPPRVPTFSVKWYAKGGVFNSPSVIGVGEAGSEAVLPLKDSVFSKIAQGINRNAPTTVNQTSKDIYPAQTVKNYVNVEWTGDIDSPDRLNELTNAIVEKITDNTTGAFS